MKRRTLFTALAASAAVCLLAAVAIALFVGVQRSYGGVSMATVQSGETLYICDAQKGEGVSVLLPNGQSVNGCKSDDNDANEEIFEGAEGLIPGGEHPYDIIIWNTSDFAWDIPDFGRIYPGETEAYVDIKKPQGSDPGEPCTLEPSIDASYLGIMQPNGNWMQAGFDIPPDGGALLGSEGYVPDNNWNQTNVIPHIIPNHGAYLRLRAIAPAQMGNECESSSWNLTIDWSVVSHEV